MNYLQSRHNYVAVAVLSREHMTAQFRIKPEPVMDKVDKNRENLAHCSLIFNWVEKCSTEKEKKKKEYILLLQH